MSAGRDPLNDTTVLVPLAGLNSCKNDDSGHLFDRIISIFFKNFVGEALIRNSPVLLGDGRNVDLLRLFVLVRDGGGFESVSRRGMWGSVMEKCGLEHSDIAAVKLVYFKYLYKFHRLLPAKMCAEFPHLLENGRGLGKNGVKNIKDIMNKRMSMVISSDGYEHDHSDVKECNGRKRWRDLSPLGVCHWIGDISNWMSFTRRRVVERREGFWDTPFTKAADLKSALQEEQDRVHLRSSSPRAHSSPSIKPCSSISKTTTSTPPHTSELSVPRLRKTLSAPKVKHVSVGPFFQARVPVFTGDVYSCDSKWTGSRIWPPPESTNQHNPARPETDDLVGRGRQDSCGCLLPGSLSCVRFHVAERKSELKQELGRAFYSFRFHEMGELASLGWTEDEEKTLKKMAMSDLLENRSFSEAVRRYLPEKTKKQVVNYYFEVYITRQRSYQNRTRQENIDSDDEQPAGGPPDPPTGFGMVHNQVTVEP